MTELAAATAGSAKPTANGGIQHFNPEGDVPDTPTYATFGTSDKTHRTRGRVMKYDDASWHYGGDLPAHLPPEAGSTHIAIFVAWCVLHGMVSDLHSGDGAELLSELKARNITPAQWFIAACDEKFTDEDLTTEGNAFAAAYYGAGGDQDQCDVEGFISCVR